MATNDKIYSVRMWDAFWNDYVMIPVTGLSRDEAIEKAKELSSLYDCGCDGAQEAQVWVDCLGGTAAQMVGYVEYDEVEFSEELGSVMDYTFVECFG